MKILQVIESLGRGGAEQALVNLLPALQRRGHQCEVAALMPPYSLAETLEKAGIAVHRLKLNHRWNLLRGINSVTSLCHRGQYDAVQAHLFFAALYVAMSKPLAPAPKRIVSFHNLDYDLYPANTPWKKVRKAIHCWLMGNYIDGWIAVGRGTSEHYKAHLGLSDIVTIPNAFPLDTLCPSIDLDRDTVLSKYGVSPNSFAIVMPGRLVPQKGHRYLFQALALLREKSLRPQVLIFGDGPLRQKIVEDVANKDLQQQVIIHPAITHGELLPIVQAADLLVMASTHEGFGLVAAEAMALERPVLATRISGVVDLIEEGVSGLLVPPKDPAALAEGIAQLIGDPLLRKRLGEAGRQRIESHFHADVIAAKCEEYYSGLFKGSPSRTQPLQQQS